MRKRRWLLFIILLLIGLALLLRRVWLPWALANGQTWLEFIDYNSPWMDLVDWLGTIISWIAAFILFVIGKTKEPPFASNDTDLLPTTSVKAIRNKGVDENDLPKWIDRDIFSLTDYHKTKIIVFEGEMKTGKTREAAELIRLAIDKKHSDENCLYDLDKAFHNMGLALQPDTLRSLLNLKINQDSRFIMYYEQLDSKVGPRLDLLAEYVNFASKSGLGHFISTVRTDHLAENPALKNWLADNGIATIPMKALNDHLKKIFLDDQLKNKELSLNEELRNEILRAARNNPYSIITIIKDLKEIPADEISLKRIREFARKSDLERWGQIYIDLNAKNPAVGALLQALKVFDKAGVGKNKVLVFALAERLERKRKPWQLPGAIRKGLKRAEARLGKYNDIKFQETILVEEVVLDGVPLPTGLSKPRTPSDLLFTFLTQRFNLFHWRDWLTLRSNARLVWRAVFELSLSGYYDNRSEDAIQSLRWLVDPDRNFIGDQKLAAAWYNLGVLLARQPGRAEEAEEAYRTATRLDPQLAGAWNNLGNLLARQPGRAEEAEEAYRKAIGIDPQYAAAWYNLGLLLDDQPGREEEAEEAYRTAARLDPQDAAAWNNLGLLLARQPGRAEEAEEAYRTAARLDPQLAAAWSNLGTLYRKLQRYPGAAAALEHALRLRPEHSADHAALGAVYMKLNRQQEAQRALAEARRLSASESTYNRACVAALSGQREEAFALLKEALQTKKELFDLVCSDPDWEDYRADPEFRRITGCPA